jgi:hypothetical protein
VLVVHRPRQHKRTVALPFDPQIEVWRPYRSGTVEYEVSNYGRVRRYLRPFVVKNHQYPQVYLSGRGKVHVHHLVAKLFIGDRPPGLVVGHKDDNPLDPSVFNLEYITQSQNIKASYRNGQPKRGPDTKPRRLTSRDERFLIVEAVRQGEPKAAVARRFKTSSTFVGWLCKHPVYGLRAERLQ